ncbi:MAG: hypothetical protein ACKPE1_07365 [Dolichospermum sp.]
MFLNRPMNGQAGFWVMTPLQLEGGAVVLVILHSTTTN